jgi:hypothetical protein
MKLRKINILTTIALVMVIMLTSCSKDDGAIPKNIGIEDVPAVTTNLESGGLAGDIILANQASFQGKFKMALYFANAAAPTKVDIVARKNGVLASVKLFKADVTSLPASFTITAAELATLFGAPLAVKDTYDFAPDIYVGNKKYEAWPASGVTGSGSGVTGMSGVGFGAQVTFTVK